MIVFLTSNMFAGNVKELQNLSLQVHMVVRLHACQCGLLLPSFTICAGKTKSCYCCLCIIVIQNCLLQRLPCYICKEVVVPCCNELHWSFSQPSQQPVIQPYTLKLSPAESIVNSSAQLFNYSISVVSLCKPSSTKRPPRIVGPFRPRLPEKGGPRQQRPPSPPAHIGSQPLASLVKGLLGVGRGWFEVKLVPCFRAYIGLV